ncbi:Substrate-specific component BioY of biotin ECF transporter [Streptococcus sp. DD12]|nr:biotin transporter BioY [Streptococcus sp. DD12]KXT75784.1 Substrate-specific component BioY of biotin ECF transporter [Streptococcus sp. DD12]
MSLLSTKRLARMAIAVALVIVCSQITVPLPGIPFTLQTFAVGLVASLLAPLDAFLACLTYLLLGAIGLPVFAGGAGGWASFVGAGGGFLIGFSLFALWTSFSTHKNKTFGGCF